MNLPTDSSPTLTCSCGKLSVVAVGEPIMTVSCYCRSCQAAAKQLARPGNPPIVGSDGGTPFVLYRKDRVDFSRSGAALCEHRLSPDSTTRRVVAACCGAPMFLEFQNGHWVSVYSERLPDTQRRAIEMRTMTRDAPPEAKFDDGIPSYRTHSIKFMALLFWAWVSMGFRSHQIDVSGQPLVADSKSA